MKLPVFQFVAVVICPVAGHHLKEPGLMLLTAALQVFISTDKILLSLLLSRMKSRRPSLKREMLQAPIFPHDPSIS